jgi:ribosomal protein L16 Arg81 hydroxylase
MKIKNWTVCIQDREKWKKEVVEKAKTFSNWTVCVQDREKWRKEVVEKAKTFSN